MDNSALIKAMEERVVSLIGAEKDLFLVEIRVKPTNNLKIYIDGDQGVSVEKLVFYNRKLYRQLEEEGVFPDGDFSLELSSPGLDEPLKMHRQYVKNIGRPVEVILNDGIKQEGVLKAVTKEAIEVESTTGKGKKAVTTQLTIPFIQIKSTKIQIKF
ncbi:MAG TPA: ribosome maturation factor [Chitinophagaceae bacterium]|jgi:ribosome maturation factor RimP|nr:ribosome maturation factor [Chitinophagaceae bacterium]